MRIHPAAGCSGFNARINCAAVLSASLLLWGKSGENPPFCLHQRCCYKLAMTMVASGEQFSSVAGTLHHLCPQHYFPGRSRDGFASVTHRLSVSGGGSQLVSQRPAADCMRTEAWVKAESLPTAWNVLTCVKKRGSLRDNIYLKK